MSAEKELQLNYTPQEDAKTLHTRAQAVAKRLQEQRANKKFIYVKHPDIPHTWIMKEVK